jgi:hypothetical protein
MRDGDTFARKFGDTTGTNSGYPQGGYPDFFKLTVRSYVGGQLGADSVEFYLADYRFANDSLDYIVDSWEWVDCSILQVFDSLKFTLSSSDNGAFGMNTPAFFCIDDLSIDVTVGKNTINKNLQALKAFPIPAFDVLHLNNLLANTNHQISIYNTNGQLITEINSINTEEVIPVGHLAQGFYTLKVQSEQQVNYIKFNKL